MKRVVIESPFAGDVEANREYLHRCCLDSLRSGESPYASHGFFVYFMDDLKPEERQLGINAGLAWADAAELVAVYTDRGISPGMSYAIRRHEANKRPIEYRSIGPTSTTPEMQELYGYISCIPRLLSPNFWM
jgi:hypothetical protein